jgi:methionine aminopeptidase
LLAAHHALEAAVRMLLPSKEHKNSEVSELITKICKIYDVSPVENMISHDISQFKMSGEKQIILNPSDEQKGKVEKCAFADYEVYILDVLVSSGEGK